MMMPPSTGPRPEARPETPPPDAHRRAAFVGGEDGRDDAQRRRHHRRPADALDDAEGDQQIDARGEAAGQRPEREEHHAADEEPAAPPEVAEAAESDQQDGEGEDVGVHHPLDVAERGAVVRLDARDGDVHDGAVEQDHEEAEAENGQHCPRAARLAGRPGLGRCGAGA
jgi:hypothetical protein